MDTAKSVTRSSLQFLSGTLISRITGMLRDMTMAFCYGTSPAIAAFLVAFRLANLMRRVFGEGALTVGFIPHFETIQKQSPIRAVVFFRDLVVAISLLLIFIIGLSELGLFAMWHWGDPSGDNQQILLLTAILLPGLLFICLSALFAALLQCNHSFFLTGVSPVAFNLVWIATAWILRNQPPLIAAQGLAVAVAFAFLLQWLILVPKAMRILRPFWTERKWWSVQLLSPDLKALMCALSMGVIGVGAMQINSAVDTLFARYASLEGPAYLNYAIRIQQLPLALFAIAIASAVLPALSRSIAAGETTRYRELLQFALLRSFSFVFPCMVGILVVGGAAVNLVFGRGHFLNESVVHTTTCLFGYGLGLVPASFVILMASAFYSRKDYWTPTLASLLAIAVNIALNSFWIFGFGWGPQSVAIATSIAACANTWMLNRALTLNVGAVFTGKLLSAFGKIASCVCLAGVAALIIGYHIGDPTVALLKGSSTALFPVGLQQQLLHFIALSGTFIVILALTAWLTGTRELLQLVGYPHPTMAEEVK